MFLDLIKLLKMFFELNIIFNNYQSKKFASIDSFGLDHKTYYGRNLRFP
jgi:hypothetical protein